MEMEADAQAFTELGVGFSGAHQRIAVTGHDAVHYSTLGHATAQDPLDAVLGHEVQSPLGAPLDGLPALHRQGLGPGHQCQLLEGVAAVGHLGRQGVVLPLVGKGLVVERLEDDVHRFFKLFAVGVLVGDVGTEGLDLASVVAASDSENHPAVGQDIGSGVVLSQAQRVPHRGDIEAAAKLDVLGHVGQVDIQHDQIGYTLIAFRLEVVLRHPHGVEPVGVQRFRDGFSFAVDGHQVVIAEFPVVDRRSAVADIGHVNVTGIQTVKFCNHLLNRLPVLNLAQSVWQ